MNCREARDLLPQHVAGELEDAEFETHLALCASCARHGELSRMVWDLSGLVPDEPVPDASIQRLYDSIERVRRRPQRRLVTLLRLGTVAAAAVFLAVAAWWWTAPRRPDVSEGAQLMDGPRFAGYLEPAFGSLEVRVGREPQPLGLRSHKVTVDLSPWVLRTEVEEIFVNTTGQRLEGTFYFPLPPDASLSRFAMEVNGTLVEGELVERVRAREVYEGIVRSMKDPALLEWMPGNIFKARIFPIEPYSEKRVILGYTQAPRMWNGALTYVYPLASEKTQNHPPDLIDIRAAYGFDRPVRNVESPTHRADVVRKDDRTGQVRLLLRKEAPANHFRIDLELDPDELAVAAHRPEGEDGYFAVGYAPRFERAKAPPGTYVFVVDRSARMSATDLEVSRRIVLSMIGKLGPADRAGIVAHHIEPWVRDPSFVTPARLKEWDRFLAELRGEGASDVLGALRAAAERAPEGATVIYVGKGVPTYGVTEGGRLAQEAAAALRGRTFRAVLVGRGGNVAGLSLVAGVRDGDVRTVAPGGDTERQIEAIAGTIAVRPVLGVELEADGVEIRDVVTDLQGAVYPGERVFLFGRYVPGDGPTTATVTVRGTVDGRRVERKREVVLPAGPSEHATVMRLWAQRVLAERVAASQRKGSPEDRQAIVKMSRTYQVMTPYTSFLVLESEEAYKKHQIERAKRLEVGKAPKEADPDFERIAEELAKGRTVEEQKRIAVSQRWYETALAHHNRGDFDKAKTAARAAVEAWHENLAARKLLDDLNQLTLGGQPAPMAEDELRGFRVRVEQAQIEITKHVRDGERLYNAGMYEEAMKEFENAEFKIRAIPYDVQAMNELLPRVRDYSVKSRNARILQGRRVHSERLRVAEAEVPPVVSPTAGGGAPTGPSSGAEWEELLRKLKQDYQISDGQKSSQADEHYRLAERYFQAGDFELAEIETEKAIQLNSGNAPAKALHLEIQFILGRHKVTPSTQEYDKYMKGSYVRHQQVVVEMDQAMARGTRFYNRGEYDKAEREYRQILEYAKWMPKGVEFDTRDREARMMMARTKSARMQASLDDEKARLRMIVEEPGPAPIPYRPAVAGDREAALNRALAHFDRAEYGDCIELCDALLDLDPSLRSVADLRERAMKTRHKEELRRVLANSRTNAVRPWRELIAKRKPKGIAELEEDLRPMDREVLRKLASIRITIDMKDAPLAAVVDYIREISGLNLHIDTQAIENPEEEILSFQASDVVLEGALRMILGPRGMDYDVEDGVVVVSSREALRNKVRLELYDVQDLTYGMQDFPGIDVNLARAEPRFPSRDEWGRISRRLAGSVVRTEGAFSEKDPDFVAIHRKLDMMKIDFGFEDTKLEDILAYTRDFSGLNIILDAAVRDQIDPDEQITFEAKDVVLKDALGRLLSRFGLGIRVTDENVVLITETDPKPWRITGEDLAALIMKAFPAGEWAERDGKSIQFQNGLLIVRNSRHVHEAVARILEHLRWTAKRSRTRARHHIEDGLESIRKRFQKVRER